MSAAARAAAALGRLADTLEADPIGAALADAVARAAVVALRYVDAKGRESVREVAPREVTPEGLVWCATTKGLRSFRLERIREVSAK